jgi:hypothetical protein
MITICLIAVGVLIFVLLWAVRGAGDGHEDETGYHADPKSRPRPRQAVRPGQEARPVAYSVPRASPWLQLPVHGQDELDLLVARTGIKINGRFPV